MTLNSDFPKKRGRPLGSKNKAKKRAFKRSNTSGTNLKPPKIISFSQVELEIVKGELEQAKVDIIGLSTIINYLEIRLEEKYRNVQ